ncbi:hypothetical protein SS1G_11960 [Sclerotinia sclerotiorum 1980 UF-70]|uniref:Haloacid dehalogenase, type II n=2 Tax=Sclerotinia sclerotiorum (strain ATCC 18683 / 1980 / Ss-1) TaxID=665079 RepID=A7F3W4_SCLS1|nr:hypothetical protein SS1G_11960 [Sclerotinia sclerotiorum 1980 UF-70]APA14245.1 hypothetical protein sscle_12g090150 [Sclerotinia sclerotiorum 1980 UF-70]EDN97435.1 hypothetical protein SS1G_11960 [Sclerotinia sclerotiorum 1980 UF-70]
MSNKKTIIAFDLYGTLLSTSSIAHELALHFGDEKAQSIAALWRRYQLEYTFRMNSMSLYKPFLEITHTSLYHALSEHKLSLSEADVGRIMNAYNSLTIFPDVSSGLENLAKDTEIIAHVFSNGTNEMVSESVNKSPQLSGFRQLFKELITVEEVECYKPHPKVYEHLVRKARGDVRREDREGVWLVSGNPFDIVGARAVGLQTCWVDRMGDGWMDRLGELASGGPHVVVKGVDEAVREIQRMSRS